MLAISVASATPRKVPPSPGLMTLTMFTLLANSSVSTAAHGMGRSAVCQLG